jgi:hypothetical protein
MCRRPNYVAKLKVNVLRANGLKRLGHIFDFATLPVICSREHITGEIRSSGIIGGPRETQPWWNCEPASQTERARTVTLHLHGRRARALSQPRGNGEQQLGGT